MRLIHLSDLHLGKNILEQTLIEDQRYILNQIIGIIKDREIDVVLISGDVYDKSIPSIDAVNLFSYFLSELYALKVKVFVISGNHDSKDRLSFGNELFVDNEVYIEGVFNGSLRKVTLNDEYGEFNVYMLPFVKPADVRYYYPDKGIDSYDNAVKVIIENTKIDSSKRNVIMVHQFVTSSGVDIERSDSESISLGGIDNVDVSLFDDFDYVALGHIHRGQKLIKDTVRYSGSPLKYSFSEVNHKKSVVIVEFKNKGDISIDLVELKPWIDMRIIRGKLVDLLEDNGCDDYISAVITDDDYIMDAIGKLRRVYPNILKLEYDNKRNSDDYDKKENVDVKLFSEIELFKMFYEKQNNISLDDKRFKIVEKVIDEVKE